MEAGTAATAGMGEGFEQHTGHIAPSHAAFLRHWLQLIDLEEAGLTARRAEIWALSGALTAAVVPLLCAACAVWTVSAVTYMEFMHRKGFVQRRADAHVPARRR